MGTGIIVLAGTVASSFFIFCLTRGMKMRDEGRRLAGLLSLVSGLLPLAAICLLWASMGDQFVWPQRVILFSTGALIGGFGLLAFGEWIRPVTPPKPPALSERQFNIESVDGKIKVSTQIPDENGKLIAELIRNEWKVAPPPSTWDRNYTDDALEVRDAFGDVVLQVKVLPDLIQLKGVWWINLGPPNGAVRLFIRGNPKDGAQVVIVPKQNKSPPPSIEPMFRYPSDQNLGELATRS